MNDEAAAHYVGIIDQMSLGLRLLNNTFGECGNPNIAWQIDPFGHSKEQAHLFAKMGFDALFFARLDYRDKLKRKEENSMEMIWKTSDEDEETSLLTGVLFNEYGPPPGYCWDLPCNDDPIIDAQYAFDNNIDKRAEDFVQFVTEQSSSYLTNHVLVTMGEDFQYQAAHSWFQNMDKLILYINSQQERFGINIFYSTPGNYITHKVDLLGAYLIN